MGPPGAPFRLGPGAKCPSCPPLWAALTVLVVNLKDFYTAPQQKLIILYQLFLEFIRLFRNIPQCFSVPIIPEIIPA